MRNLLVATLVAALSLPAQPVTGRIRWDAPQTVDAPHGRSSWWKLSVVAAAAAAAADSHSSWGRLETNPLLRGSNGRFGLQSLALKALITGGAIGVQYLILRKHPNAEKYGVATNMIMAGVLGTAAAINYRRAAAERAESRKASRPAGLLVSPIRQEDIEFVPRFSPLVR
ncbi:MAG: hypothetical protein SFV51_09010 [Bryobacteraceae bacterium]|nr:hypothetical protein [Bryobacteraceae bacterium]